VSVGLVSLKELRGMRFPDDYIIRMFFKESLHLNTGRVLELGCGTGNNLSLFAEYGWEVVGIDISENALSDALFNFSDKPKCFELYQVDLSKGMPTLGGKFDAIILPNVNYYIPRKAFLILLHECNLLLKPDGIFYIRSRTCADWRYGKGYEVETNGFLLNYEDTGEDGLLNVFYETEELMQLCDEHLCQLKNRRVLQVNFQNIQNGKIVTNDDIVIWGRK